MLNAHVFTSSLGDFSNGGISGWAREVTVVNAEGCASENPERPAVLLMAGAYPGIAKAVPAVKERYCVNCNSVSDGSAEPICSVDGLTSSHCWQDRWTPERRGMGPMMGGAYISTSDSRFTEAVEALTGARFYGAVALHDRFETGQYASHD